MKPCKISSMKCGEDGYPYGKNYRRVCEQANGPRPPGMEASHICNMRNCEEPSHLVWETRSQNERRKSYETRQKTARAGGRVTGDKLRGTGKGYYYRIGKYHACASVNGVRTALGSFSTAEEAHAAYVAFCSKV